MIGDFVGDAYDRILGVDTGSGTYIMASGCLPALIGLPRYRAPRPEETGLRECDYCGTVYQPDFKKICRCPSCGAPWRHQRVYRGRHDE